VLIENKKILVTGAHGFIGKNLTVSLKESSNVIVTQFLSSDSLDILFNLVSEVDVVIHLAGVNRPIDDVSYQEVNSDLTLAICNAIEKEYLIANRQVQLVFASSKQVELDNLYGKSKLSAEAWIDNLAKKTGNSCVIFRLPGVFGKWCKPFYNSVVATFCHNISRGLPIQINDPNRILSLVYVDDVVNSILSSLLNPPPGCKFFEVEPLYSISIEDLAKNIYQFDLCRSTLITERVGTGFLRALYATYLSYLPVEKFTYSLPIHADNRGVFVEMLKTPDCGQFSYFTAFPGITRGGHYHHTKTEKFLLIKGLATFRFRNLQTNELVELNIDSRRPEIVDTIPGWTHDITNVGTEEMVVMIWANENFNHEKPDTFANKVV
jgi:UDP-2-acetamido-2,6-beta-L-arabino-hexul-4-ose reductase